MKHALQLLLEHLNLEPCRTLGPTNGVKSFLGCSVADGTMGVLLASLLRKEDFPKGIDVNAVEAALQDTRQYQTTLGPMLYWPSVPFVSEGQAKDDFAVAHAKHVLRVQGQNCVVVSYPNKQGQVALYDMDAGMFFKVFAQDLDSLEMGRKTEAEDFSSWDVMESRFCDSAQDLWNRIEDAS